MISKMVFLAAIAAVLLGVDNASASIKTKSVEYSSNGTVMEGFLAYDDAQKQPQPGILIVHDYMGLGEFTKSKAKQLAGQGYIAFAVDIYGKEGRPGNPKEATQLVNKFKNDRKLLRGRIRAAYDKLTSMKEVDPKKIIVMGYCFGGMTALELGRSGTPLAGIVSFHGVLSNPTPEDAKNIKSPVLVLHGADDPHVPPSEVAAFKEEMKNASVDLKFIAYKGAVHGFTNPAAGTDTSKGVAYNANADKESWNEFQKFLNEVLKKEE